jgi:hypothetical protein
MDVGADNMRGFVAWMPQENLALCCEDVTAAAGTFLISVHQCVSVLTDCIAFVL